MKIIVCVKQVPDSAVKPSIENGKLDWHDTPLVINPWDEFAVEAALAQKDAHSENNVITLSVGPESAKEALKQTLAMGCSEAVLISDPALSTSDSQITARVIAAAIQKIGETDLVILGRQSIDTDMGTTAVQVARILGWPVLTLVSAIASIDLGAHVIQVERLIEEGRQLIESCLPAVISVVKDIGEPRYPSFMGIRKAQKTPIPNWSLADIGLTFIEPAVTCIEVIDPPQQKVLTEMITGRNPQEIAEILVERIMAERIL
jgi:electron transfer flavoprotein beta subunit